MSEGSSSAPASPGLSDDGQNAGEAPLTMEASTLLTTLPVDTKHALASAGKLPLSKVRIHVQPVAGATPLKTTVFALTSSHRFELLVQLLRKKLRLQPHESLFCYVGSVFAPALDETVENLWRCFKQGPNRELYVQYAVSPAFG
ncbi:APG12-domain-containing protein [Bimuria novae-zelandiae CBS 107.79]|uniref:Ubiquitin-like protein ATG12 n=1 Tax=Bimuria novae-zelandiae CBS 107.79 TaxID=1447943 RepID=A0A6A5VP09_9PLEO|nr:APG12-domain-containing protein [Bimuria novae-zelandiae CBS 107.79]